MVVNRTKNYPALILYLDRFGIDATRVKEEGADVTGYDYIVVDRSGRPMPDSTAYAFRPKTKRMEWPNAEVWPNVARLLAGEGLEDIDPPKEPEAPEKDTKVAKKGVAE